MKAQDRTWGGSKGADGIRAASGSTSGLAIFGIASLQGARCAAFAPGVWAQHEAESRSSPSFGFSVPPSGYHEHVESISKIR